MTLLSLLDQSGVALMAATGALAASRKQLDIIGFVFLGALTGLGGGTVRDLILGVPVFWILQPGHILICTGAAVTVFLAAHLFESRYRLLLWLDALGLAAYGVFGAYKGLTVTGSATIAVVMGVLTGTLGGILRDVIAREPSVLLRQEVYVAAVLTGTALFIALLHLGAPLWLAAGGGVMTTFGLRGGTIRHGWTLPAYKSRPGRPPTP